SGGRAAPARCGRGGIPSNRRACRRWRNAPPARSCPSSPASLRGRMLGAVHGLSLALGRMGTPAAVAAGLAFATDRRKELFEIFLAVVVGDLLAGLDVAPGVDLDLTLDAVGHGVRPARVVDVAGGVAAGRAVDRPARVEIEQIFALQVVDVVRAHQLAKILDDELALANRLGRIQPEPGGRAADAGGTRLMRRGGAPSVLGWHAGQTLVSTQPARAISIPGRARHARGARAKCLWAGTSTTSSSWAPATTVSSAPPISPWRGCA